MQGIVGIQVALNGRGLAMQGTVVRRDHQRRSWDVKRRIRGDCSVPHLCSWDYQTRIMHERARATDANSPIYAPLKARGRDDVPEYYDTSNTVPRMVHEGSVSWKATKNTSLLPSRTPRGMKNLYLHLHDKPDKPRVQLLTSPADRSPPVQGFNPACGFCRFRSDRRNLAAAASRLQRVLRRTAGSGGGSVQSSLFRKRHGVLSHAH